jgi:hypothetical protein
MLGMKLVMKLPHPDNSCASMTELWSPYNEIDMEEQDSLHSDQFWYRQGAAKHM